MSIIMLMAMAAGAVAMPMPSGSPDRWLKIGDIPKAAFEAGDDGAFFFKALVAPDGKVEQCSVLASNAPKGDWDDFCAHVKRRFGFGAVTDPQGAPSYYVLEENYAYILPETWLRNGATARPDMIVDVQSLPGAKEGRLGVAVNVAVDAAGGLRECNAADAAQTSLANLACGQLKVNWAPMPERNAAGAAIAYIRQMNVQFRETKGR